MNTIQKAIEEGLKIDELMALIREGHESVINHEEVEEYEIKVKAFLSTTISNILDAIDAEVEGREVVNEGKPNTEMTYPHYEFGYRCGYNQSLSDIQALLKSAKKQ